MTLFQCFTFLILFLKTKIFILIFLYVEKPLHGNETSRSPTVSRDNRICSAGYQTNSTTDHVRESPEVATELEQRFLQGPVGSFAEDSPTRHTPYPHPDEKRNLNSHNSPLPPPYPNYQSIYSHTTAQHGGPSMYSENSWSYGPPPYGYQSSAAPAHQPPPYPYNYPPYSYLPPASFPSHSPSYYNAQAATSYESTQPVSRGQLQEISRSPIAPDDWATQPEGLSLTESFGVADDDPTNNDKDPKPYDFFTHSDRPVYSSDSSVSTPEKKPGKRGGNPFRSPKTTDSGSAFLQPSPNLSFNILDTPPVGNYFPQFDDTFDSSRLYSSSYDDESIKDKAKTTNSKSKTLWKTSPLPSVPVTSTLPASSPQQTTARSTRLALSASPNLHGVPRSPVQSASKTIKKKNAATTRKSLTTTPEKPNLKRRSHHYPIESSTSHRTIRSSPVAPSSEVRPRNLWQQSAVSSKHLVLGQAGTRVSMSAQQRTFDDINTMMRSQQSQWGVHSSASGSMTQPSFPSMHGHSIHPGYYHGQPPYLHYQHSTPMRENPVQPLSRPSSVAYRHSSVVATPSTSKSLSKKQLPIASGGKENRGAANPGASSDHKKGVCNCKKSRCLKLYCECFAARLYCDGCNCKDCHNTPEYEPEREKAVSQALSKNRAAFDPRIAEEHNMGCKCRRSQCLKKYCEVRRIALSIVRKHHLTFYLSVFKPSYCAVRGVNVPVV
jgi:Tesmin/TSO1-like CXC domain, cysteine-rich domain